MIIEYLKSLPWVSDSAMGLYILLLFWIAFHIFKKYKKEKENRLLLYFSKFFFFHGLFVLFIIFPDFFASSGSFAIAYIGFGIGLLPRAYAWATLMRIPAFLEWPKYELKIFYSMLVFHLIPWVLVFFNPFNAIYDTQMHVKLINMPPFLGGIIFLSMAAVVSPFIYVFVKQAFKTSKPFVKRRAFLLSVGFLLLLATGPMHNFGKTALHFFLIEIGTAISALVIFSGIIYHQKAVSSEDINSSQSVL